MNKIAYLLLILTFACSPKPESDKSDTKTILGNWSFLDGRGNYNEAFFGDSTYTTFAMKYGAAPYFSYLVKNDSLYSDIDKRKTGLNRIAEFTWINANKVVLVTEFSRDTLDRIQDPKNTLQNNDPAKDSLTFYPAFKKRYEDFLIAKGILTREEIEQFKNDSLVPEDVIKSL